MKKLIFLLLLAQTISFLYAESGCQKHSWRWGIKKIEQVNCDCNCKKYNQVNYTCPECQHKTIPTAIKLGNSKKTTRVET